MSKYSFYSKLLLVVYFDVFAKHLNSIKLSLKHTFILTVDLTYSKQTYVSK